MGEESLTSEVAAAAAAPPRNLTTEEVADRFRTTPETVRYWRHSGKGPHSWKVGKRVLYALEDVEAWEREAREGASVA
jgi:excisionase family DNA binding protein